MLRNLHGKFTEICTNPLRLGRAFLRSMVFGSNEDVRIVI